MIQARGVSPKVLGERLRVARTTAGKTQEDAARALGVARTTVVAVEAGDRRVRNDELLRLAELYGVSVNSLLRETAIHVDLVAQFRRTLRAAEDESVSSAAIQLLHKLGTAYVELERLLKRPLHTHYPPEYPIGRGNAQQQAEDLAAQLRGWLGVGLSPIPDVVSMLELEFGLRIFVRGLDSGISGVVAYHPDLGGCILLNAKHPRTRRAWTAAHDVTHFMTERHVPDVCHVEAGRVSPSERFADLTASAFLMPASAVRRRFAETCADSGAFSARHLILLAHAFYVSPEAMCRRLEDLELLPRGTFEMLRERKFGQQTVRTVLGDREPESELLPVPPRLGLLVADASRLGLVSEGQLADMLVLDRVEVRRLIDAFGEDEEGGVGAQRA